MNNEIYDLAAKAVRLLNDNKLHISTAESCTGGLLSAYITAVPGSSAVFETGAATYSVDSKNRILGVSGETLAKHGAVSPETAAEMARCVRNLADADIGMSVTGVAGPDGSEGHMPGLVFIALDDKRGVTVKKLEIEPLGREYVRETAVRELLTLVIKTVGKYSQEGNC